MYNEDLSINKNLSKETELVRILRYFVELNQILLPYQASMDEEIFSLFFLLQMVLKFVCKFIYFSFPNDSVSACLLGKNNLFIFL
jgi:hypothetical protein